MERITNIHKFITHPIRFLDLHFNEGKGPAIKRVKLGHKSFVLVFDPEMAREILIRRSNVFVQNRTIFNRIKPVTGARGLVQLNGEESKTARKRVRPIFTPSNLEQMRKQILTYTEYTLATLDEGPLEITQIMTKLILRTAFKLFLGLDIENDSTGIGQDFLELNRLCGKRMTAIFPLPNRRIAQLSLSLRSRIEHLLLTNPTTEMNVFKAFEHDLDLIDHCMTFLFAGHETTASSLSFTFLLLARHPEYQRRIAAGDIDLALQVYKESLRLYPPAYMLVREATEDALLAEFKIRKGEQVIIGLSQIHRRSDYFPEPDKFIPQRPDSDAFMPFGLGPKSCIGEGMAYLEAVTVIKAFCLKFEIQEHESGIKAVPHITLHPAPAQFIGLREVVYG